MNILLRIFLLGFTKVAAGVMIVFAASISFAQTDDLAVPLIDPASGEYELNTVQSLEALQRSLQSKENELAGLQQQLAAANDDISRDDIRKNIIELKKEIEEQRLQFEGFAVDIDLSPFIPNKEPAKFDWQEKVGQLLEPIMAEVENATKESRVIGQLRTQIADVGQRRDLAERAVENLDKLLQQQASAELTARLTGQREVWSRTLEQARNEYTALDLQLQSRLAARESVLDQGTKFARDFFRTRGLNLLLGILAFCFVFFGFRLAQYLMHRFRKDVDKKSFSSRLTALLFHVFSVLGGLLAMMAVFNLVGDWFLLGIIVIFLFGVGWASINTLPQQVETIKLMLNIGAVREGEVLIYEGMAYRVDSLGFSAKLNNPLLDGGIRIIPVKYLVNMTSRRPGEREAWFPCREGDWVELSDGKSGRVTSQTPSAVAIVELGGARLVYPTAGFLSLNPKNLSSNYRIESTFGIDYKHQSQATVEIPAKMKEKLQVELSKLIDPPNVLNVSVAFSSASASSLDYTIAVDLKGDSAHQARDIRLAIPRILVDACNENGWRIPFTQITVHQAG